MMVFVLEVLLVAAFAVPRPGDADIIPQHAAKLFVCPSYRETDSGDESVPYHKLMGRNDPLWLLEKEDEWIPYRALGEQEQLQERHQIKTFRCIFYYLAAFSHFMLDLFTPSIPVYYVHPYYKMGLFEGESALRGEDSGRVDSRGTSHPPPRKSLTF